MNGNGQNSLGGRGRGDFKIGVAVSLVRGHHRGAAEAGDNGSGTVVTASSALLELLGDGGHDRGEESGDESELHGEGWKNWSGKDV